jgi:hypothetical protein
MNGWWDRERERERAREQRKVGWQRRRRWRRRRRHCPLASLNLDRIHIPANCFQMEKEGRVREREREIEST